MSPLTIRAREPLRTTVHGQGIDGFAGAEALVLAFGAQALRRLLEALHLHQRAAEQRRRRRRVLAAIGVAAALGTVAGGVRAVARR